MAKQTKRIVIVDGPNLNKVGTREPHIYGTVSIAEWVKQIKKNFPDVAIEYRQSNHEGVLIDWLQQLDAEHVDGIVLNAGGYTHTSVALADAIRSIRTPVIEVHISNIAAREEYRRHSFLAPVVKGSISGLGLYGYHLAILALLNNQSTENHVQQTN